MSRVLAAEPAVLLGFKLIRMLLLVFISRVVSMLAHRTFKSYIFAHVLSYRYAALLKIKFSQI